tara:strand:+ start:23484 stop:26180 length:2697 start_codon:yes stop_codon:yes gene_type:complete
VDIQVYDLKDNQSFIADKSTTFSWKIRADENNWQQEHYHILVGDSEQNIENNIGDYWDSGKINNQHQLHIPYSGKAFSPGEKYYWKVKVYDRDGNASNWSRAESFISPLTSSDDWKAKWITYDYTKEAPMPLFRKQFILRHGEKPISARLFICGLGYYEAYLNGNKIGNRVLEPAQTNYDDYALYSAYDIPVSEIAKENALGIMLGNGWYNQHVVWTPAMAYGQPLAIAQLIIQYKNGQTDTIATDETWKWKSGPVTFSNVYAGEVYDANFEVPDWCLFTADEKDWEPAKQATTFPPKLIEQTMEPIRRMQELPTVRILEPSSKTYVFDFGQNFAGWARLKVNGKKGQKITLRFSEEIDEENNIDPTSTGVKATKVVQTDQYICKGDGVEVWEPRFTYHGFRYVEVTGLESKPEKDLLTGIVVYSSMNNTGTFSCSEPQINRLHDLAVWTIKSNVHGIPTDCPHRERCGWTGDAHALAPSLIMNFDARQFLTKYMHDMRSSARNTNNELYFGLSFHDRSIVPKPAGVPTMIVPGKRTSGIASPDWGTAVTQVPWQLYLRYGDSAILHEFYPDMKTWVDYIIGKFPDYIVNHGLGDWCPPGGNDMIDCPVALSSTAFHYLDLKILTKTAQLLGYSHDAMYYAGRMNKVKEQFNALFFDAERNSYGGQTATAMAIQVGLVPEGKTPEVVEALVRHINAKNNGFMQTGIFGLGRIFPSLAENGAEDLAFSMLTTTGEHSFAYMWEKFDATTLWEILPVNDVLSAETLNGRSHSHPMNAGYDEWFFCGIAGINPDEKAPGFKHIVFRPYFTSKLEYAEATYESPYGTIVSSWRWEGDAFTWNIKIPANSGADIFIPKLFKNQQVSVNGVDDGVNLTENTSYPGFYLYKSVGSGIYHLKIMEK